MSHKCRFELIFFTLLLAACSVQSYYLEVWEGPEYRIPDSTYSQLTLSFCYNSSDPDDASMVSRIVEEQLSVVVHPYTEVYWHVIFANSTLVFSPEDIQNKANQSFTIISYYWGYFSLTFYGALAARPSDVNHGVNNSIWMGEKKLLRNDTIIIVDRRESSKIADTAFMIGAVSFSLFNTVLMGSQLDLQIILAVIKRPVGPLCGIFCQFICMPLFSFGVGWLLLDDPLQRLGLFTLGCSPGGQNSNFWTLLYNGDINLSITMTFCSTIIAMAMMPTWMYLLGSKLLGEGSSITIPYMNLITSLIGFSVPLFIGLLIKYKKYNWAVFAGKIIKPMTFCMILYFISFGMYNNYKGFALITGNVALAGLMVAAGGYTAGALMSTLFCLKKKTDHRYLHRNCVPERSHCISPFKAFIGNTRQRPGSSSSTGSAFPDGPSSSDDIPDLASATEMWHLPT
ncbi:uncharacterized protein LOC108678553 isoform X2 [Hyalella azteca]|uniref:Uncharacterized protein LOC108678553 isoform X2 n=1 Tax=Hyalella azteca TaxID=294128 RepID=A0A8B7PBB0_HYAAZ|nr:uncharacterized protein LOC108678553 isoform X2 [Hyalella azteca]